MARRVARCWGRLARACGCFQPLAGGKNREGRPASSGERAVCPSGCVKKPGTVPKRHARTGRFINELREARGLADGHGSGSARCQSFAACRKYLTHPPIVRETAKTTGARRKKYETNPIPSKPIAINELRLVLRAAGKIGDGGARGKNREEAGVEHRKEPCPSGRGPGGWARFPARSHFTVRGRYLTHRRW